jgi:hypothetical protein
MPKIFATAFFLFVLCQCVKAQDSVNFIPPSIAPKAYAIPVKDNIMVDGRLDEESWKLAPVIKNFFMMQPRQGGKSHYETFVKIVFDKKNLYFGVFCKDSLGKKGVRVQDYRRDFSLDNDVFMIQLDPDKFERIRQDRINFQTNLYNAELRTALNPQLQLSAFYQYNSYDHQGQWNARASWEFAPLSFLYLVYNQNDFAGSPVTSQSVITKISYLKQF